MSVILCTAGYDHTIRFWEALSGLCCRQIPHTDSQINRLCISPNKQFLAVAGRLKVYLYSCRIPEARGPSSDHASNPERTFEGHTGNITGVAFHVDSKWMVTSSEDGSVRVWDTKTAHTQRNYQHGSPVNDVVIHPNQGELISCDRGGNVRVWDLGQNKCSHQLVPEDDVSISSVSVAADGSMLCAGNNAGNIFVWRLDSLNTSTFLVPHCKFPAHNTYITRVLLSPDSLNLATCSADHTAKIWKVDLTLPPPGGSHLPDSQNGHQEQETDQEKETAIANLPTSAYKTANTNPALQHNHAQQHPSIPQYSNNASTPTRITRGFTTSMNGARGSFANPGAPSLAAQSPGAFELLSTLADHQRWVWDCAFSADSMYLVTACSDHYARLWDLTEKTVIRQYQGHHRGLVCVALNDYSAN